MPGLPHEVGQGGAGVASGGGKACPQRVAAVALRIQPARNAVPLTRRATALSDSPTPVGRPTLVTAQNSGRSRRALSAADQSRSRA